MLLIYTYIVFDSNWRRKALFFVFFVFISIFADIMATSFVAITQNTLLWESVTIPIMYRVAIFSIQKIIFVLLFSIAGYYLLKVDTILPFSNWIVFLLSFSVLLILIIFILCFGYANGDSEGRLNTILTFTVLSLTLIYFSIIYFFQKINSYFSKALETNLIEHQNEMIEKYILQKEEADQTIRILNHDLKHNFFRWKQIAESEGDNEILNSIQAYERLLEENRIIDIGNNIANAMLNQKLLYAKKNNIRFNIQGAFTEGLLLTSTELCSLLGNLVDNALEAVLKIHDVQQRKIFLSIKRDKTFLLIELKNSYEREPFVKNNKFITTKENKAIHGIGLISINTLVEKYGGAIEVEYKNHIFESTIMLRAYEIDI